MLQCRVAAKIVAAILLLKYAIELTLKSFEISNTGQKLQ